MRKLDANLQTAVERSDAIAISTTNDPHSKKGERVSMNSTQSKWLVLLIGGLVAGLGVYDASADVYDQHTQATIGDITTQTVATAPADRTRTTVGIGEEVTCSIDIGTWSDKDCNKTLNKVEDDTLGSISWSVSAGLGAVAPGTGASSTFTASQTPGGSTVKATVVDSGEKYDDVVIKTVGFSVIAPTGATVTFDSDNSTWTAGPPNNQIGMDQKFVVTLSPATVNFYNAQFREDRPGDTWTWPDGTNDSYTASRQTFTVGTIGGSHNRYWHTSMSHHPIARLDNGSGYQGFAYTIRNDLQYQNASATWVSFKNNFNSLRRWRGSDQKARIELISIPGTYVGPWQN